MKTAWWLGLRVGWLVLVCACAREAGLGVTPAEVRAIRVAKVPAEEPESPIWTTAPEHVEKLLLQDQTDPKQNSVSVAEVHVRAVHDGAQIALRLEWEDPSRDAVVGPARFSDAAAVQFPVLAGGDVPDAAMGLAGKPVRIHHWQASRQEAASGQDPLKVLYPTAHTDHYPFEAASDEGSRAEMEARYMPARAVGNPVAQVAHATQDLWAEGFGTLTADPKTVSRGRGVHDGKRWRVVIARPLDASDSEALRPGARTYAAFAVWDGGHGDVGARKMRTGWVPLQLE